MVIRALDGGRPRPELSGFDGDVTCHCRTLPLNARESGRAVAGLEEVAAPNRRTKLPREHEPVGRMICQGQGSRARPVRPRPIPAKLRDGGLWRR